MTGCSFLKHLHIKLNLRGKVDNRRRQFWLWVEEAPAYRSLGISSAGSLVPVLPSTPEFGAGHFHLKLLALYSHTMKSHLRRFGCRFVQPIFVDSNISEARLLSKLQGAVGMANACRGT